MHSSSSPVLSEWNISPSHSSMSFGAEGAVRVREAALENEDELRSAVAVHRGCRCRGLRAASRDADRWDRRARGRPSSFSGRESSSEARRRRGRATRAAGRGAGRPSSRRATSAPRARERAALPVRREGQASSRARRAPCIPLRAFREARRPPLPPRICARARHRDSSDARRSRATVLRRECPRHRLISHSSPMRCVTGRLGAPCDAAAFIADPPAPDAGGQRQAAGATSRCRAECRGVRRLPNAAILQEKTVQQPAPDRAAGP